MTKTFAEAINGIRTAIYGREVREDIAQMGEYVEQFAQTATQKATEANSSASAAKESENASKQALTDTKAVKTDAVEAIEAAETDALTSVANATTAAQTAASNASNSAADAAKSEANAGTKATAAAGSASAAAESERISKEYLDQVKTISTGAQGWYATPDALRSAVPIGENGWWAVVGSTDTIWTWDSDTGAWVDSWKETDFSDFYSIQQVDEKLAGKSNVGHTHTRNQITDFPESLKSPHALTIQANGTTLTTYDGSSEKSVNVTKSSIGLENVDNTADNNKNVKYAVSSGSVNGYTFSTTTTDPGAGGELTTNAILLVYE